MAGKKRLGFSVLDAGRPLVRVADLNHALRREGLEIVSSLASVQSGQRERLPNEGVSSIRHTAGGKFKRRAVARLAMRVKLVQPATQSAS